MGGRTNSRGKKPLDRRFGHFWRDEPFTALGKTLRDSNAYRTLSATEKLVLVDWMRVFDSASWNDKDDLRKKGFCYTYSLCELDIPDRTFRRSKKPILVRKFFECPPLLQSGRPGDPYWFLPSRDWREYEPTAAEQEKIKQWDKRKLRTLDRDHGRRREYREKKLYAKKQKR